MNKGLLSFAGIACAIVLLYTLATGSKLAEEQDILLADFEGDDYGEWTAEGDAFGDGPAPGTLPNQMQVEGYQGNGLANSYLGGDESKGRLISPEFTLERPYLNFLIGGGGYEGETCINLVVDGEVVRTATGPNTNQGGSERLEWHSWDVADLLGETAVIRIIDHRAGGWGHINIDHIVLSEEPRASTPADLTREIELVGRYLLFPVSNSEPACRMEITIGGELVHAFDINLASGEPDWWGKLDLSEYAGEKATVSVNRLPNESQGLATVTSSDELRHTQPLYDEALRPQLRVSQMRGWNNDPNGMVYYDGEYHFFWQSNPFGRGWANMYWGHAVSTDLVHWQELPVALYPWTMAAGHCFSGSAHVDENNTGGWQSGDEQVMVAAFTDTAQGEALAVSIDRGRTWEYIDENPIIPHPGRDPKLVWYEPGQHWVIAVYDEVEGQSTAFYTSSDLKEWELASRLGGFFECPELFELPVDGDEENTRWVVFAADAQYLVGSFDGKTFTPDPEFTAKQQLHYGHYYASQCFSRVPDGRVIQVGWARIDMPGMPFNQAFSLPTELTLRTTDDGIRLFAEPIAELETLRGEPLTVEAQTLAAETPVSLQTAGQLYDVLVEVKPGEAREIVLRFGGNQVRYDVAAGTLDEMPLPLQDSLLRFRVIIDRPMYEIVGGGGAVYKTAARSDGGQTIESISLTTTGGEAELGSLTVYPLESIWQEQKIPATE